MNRKGRRHYDWIVVTTNDLNQDRRMIRTCNALTRSGKSVLLIGRTLRASKRLIEQKFSQIRVSTKIEQGPVFYMLILLALKKEIKKHSYDALLCTDLDTTMLAFLLGEDPKIKKVVDLHEYFDRVPELKTNLLKRKIWQRVGKTTIPKFDIAYTVNKSLANIFKKEYAKQFSVIRNVPSQLAIINDDRQGYKIKTVYLGVLNPDRGIEELIIAFSQFPKIELHILGDGPLRDKLESLAVNSTNIFFYGTVDPQKISNHLQDMHYGWNLLNSDSASYYYSLANKFFDYINNGVVPITMSFPEYITIIERYDCGYLMEGDLTVNNVRGQLSNLIKHFDKEWQTKHHGCRHCAMENNWEIESQKLMNLIDVTQTN